MNDSQIRRTSALAGISALVGSALLLTACSGCSTSRSRVEDHGITFERHEIVTGVARRQIVLTGFFTGGRRADLAVVSVDEDSNRRLQMYRFDGEGWSRMRDDPLRPEVLFVGVGNIGGRDRLLTYERDLLRWLDPETGTEHALLAIPAPDHSFPAAEIGRVDIARDVNGDGRDDLVVPGSDGFRLFLQTPDGEFEDAVRLGPPSRLRWSVQTNPWLQSLLHVLDYDRDGRTDLVFWNRDRIEAHLQDERGRFPGPPVTATTDVAFDSAGLFSLTFDEAGREHHQPRRVLSGLDDLDGDGVIDLAIASVAGGGLDTTYGYEVHRGTRGADGRIGFPSEPDGAISSGIVFGSRHEDLDGDGQTDLLLIVIHKPGLLTMVGGYVSEALTFDLEIYRMGERLYPAFPTETRRFRGDFNEDNYHLALLLGDVSGDGRADLLLQHRKDELRIFPGVPGPGSFARRYQRVEVSMPDNEKDTRLVDLDGDDRPDVLMHHRYTDDYWLTTDPDEPNRITMLIPR